MFRVATSEDLVPLRDLERAANLVALAHVYPPDRYPFPDDALLARWRLVLDDPEVHVVVADDPAGGGLLALAAYDDTTVRHLAVHPDHWGEGLASRAISLALHEIARGGAVAASLWCLRENRRARKLYQYLGWRETGEEQEAPWPPHPPEVRYTKLIVQSER